MKTKIEQIYKNIESYSRYKKLDMLERALPFIYEKMNSDVSNEAEETRRTEQLFHAFEVCMLLIDLKIPIDQHDEDILLTAALLHVYPENIDATGYAEVIQAYSREVLDIIELTMPRHNISDEELRAYYKAIENNRIALLLALADRGNVVQHLYRYSTWNAHRYIAESKACYYSMGIDGRERYPELFAAISVLVEKLKSLIEVAEILLRRYEERETELLADILAIKEENATIRSILKRY